MKTKILVTGLNGLIGWNVFCCAQAYGEVWGTYRKEEALLRRPGTVKVNLDSDGEVHDLVQRIAPDILIHSWAMCDLDVCEENAEMAYRINVEGTQRFLSAARRSNVKKFIYVSTDHVFGGSRGLYHEDDVPDPIHVYGRTKATAEQKVVQGGLPCLIIRPGLVIGQSLQGNKGPRDFLLYRIRQSKPIHYFVDEWRTPIHAHEMAEAVLRLSLSNQQGIVHLAGTSLVNRYDLACHLAVQAGFNREFIFPRCRAEDKWARIRPANLGLISRFQPHLSFALNLD